MFNEKDEIIEHEIGIGVADYYTAKDNEVFVQRSLNKKLDSYIPIRCSAEDKEKLKKKASKEHLSLSSCVLKSALAGTERKACKEHKRIENLVRRTDLIQGLSILKNQNPDKKKIELPVEYIDMLLEMEVELWRT